MLAPSRQKEENEEILARLKPDYQHFLHLPNFYKKTIIPQDYEAKALEGTGSLIFDSINKKIYCAVSERADEQLIDDFLLRFNTISNCQYSMVTFTAVDEKSRPYYHTNVMMAILEKHAVVCLESIKDPQERERVVAELNNQDKNVSPKKIINLQYSEVNSFCGNVLCLRGAKKTCLVMSEVAFKGLREHNRAELQRYYQIVKADVSLIEKIGGGGTRCMLAEIF